MMRGHRIRLDGELFRARFWTAFHAVKMPSQASQRWADRMLGSVTLIIAVNVTIASE